MIPGTDGTVKNEIRIRRADGEYFFTLAHAGREMELTVYDGEKELHAVMPGGVTEGKLAL